MERIKVRRQSTILQTAIPPKRGPAKHTETEGDLAVTIFDGRGLVKEIKTPADAFRRVHEVMHANNTDCFEYPTIQQQVKDIVEDCRLHLLFWPWKGRETPQTITDSASSIVELDVKALKEAIKEGGRSPEHKQAISFARFACSLRAQAIAAGIGEKGASIPILEVPTAQQKMIEKFIPMLQDGQHHAVAVTIQSMFFPTEEEKKSEEKKKKRESFLESYTGEAAPPDDFKDPKEVEAHKSELAAIEKAIRDLHGKAGGKYGPDRMTIVTLDHTEATSHLTTGFRQATTGPRIYRPALRKPILPQRIFYKPSPVSPKGTIVFDSSGSMQITNELLQDCCLRAPTATIGYYFGSDGHPFKGKLIIYAKDGNRAKEIHPIEDGGNGVDALVLEWLMQQEGPRVYVTDRRFTGPDAELAKARLEHLEFCGEVEVVHSFREFQKIYPHVEHL